MIDQLKLPLRVSERTMDCMRHIMHDGEDRVVCLIHSENDDVANAIVKAVNCHAGLLAALKAVSNEYDPTGCENCGVIGGETIDLVNAAIRKAEQD